MVKRIRRNLRVHLSFVRFGELESGAEVEVVIEGDKEIIIGRSKSHSTISLNDESVSRAHFSFSKKDNALWIKDLKTKNGTKLNEEDVGLEPMLVGETDIIRAGDHTVVVKKIERIDVNEEVTSVIKVQHRDEDKTRSFK